VLRTELQARAEAVRLARTVAEYPRGRHELTIALVITDTLLRETYDARGVGRLLESDAAIRSHDGDLERAIDSCRAVLCVGRSIGDEPFLISQIVRAAIGRSALRAARRVLGQGEPPDAALARFQALVEDERNQPLLLIGMKGERAGRFEMIRRIRDGEIPIDAVRGVRYKQDEIPAFREPATPWGRLYFDFELSNVLDLMNRAVAIARQPAAKRPALWLKWEDDVQGLKDLTFGLFSPSLSVASMHRVTAAYSAQAYHQAELGATIVLLAAERQRQRTGRWPASAGEIDRTILPEPPTDPYSGEPFRVEQREGQLIVHSVGRNRKDEQGADDPKLADHGGPDDVGARAWDVALRRQAEEEEDGASTANPDP
jgi:hypothetical protein